MKEKISKEMQLAFINDDFETMKTLIINKKASPNDADQRKKCLTTPLMRAAVVGNEKMASWLIEMHADVNQSDSQDWTALHYACEYKRFNIIFELLSAGANVNFQNNRGATPLLRVVAQNDPLNIAITRLLLQAGADPEIKNAAGISAIEVAPDLINEALRSK